MFKKFLRESTRGLPSCSASPAEVQLPIQNEIVISTESIENVFLKLIIKIGLGFFFSHQEENKRKCTGNLQCGREL